MKTRKEARALREPSCTCCSYEFSYDSKSTTAMQKADGLQLVQFKIGLWFLLGCRRPSWPDLWLGILPWSGRGIKRKVAGGQTIEKWAVRPAGGSGEG